MSHDGLYTFLLQISMITYGQSDWVQAYLIHPIVEMSAHNISIFGPKSILYGMHCRAKSTGVDEFEIFYIPN